MLPNDTWGMPITHEDGVVKGRLNPHRIRATRMTTKGTAIMLSDFGEVLLVKETEKELMDLAAALMSYQPLRRSVAAYQGSLAQTINKTCAEKGEPGLWLPYPDAPDTAAIHKDEAVFMTKAEIKGHKGQWERAVAFKGRQAHDEDEDIIRNDREDAAKRESA